MSQYGDGDYCDLVKERTQVARKPHKCAACHETIQPGQKYTYIFSRFYGANYITKRCERCQAIYDHLSERIANEGDCEEFCDAELNCGHPYEERWDEPPPEHIAALAFWLPGDPLPEPRT